MNTTYNADNKWYWATSSGPMPALKHMSKAMDSSHLLHQMDHEDRQKLEDGNWEYTWHPYTTIDSFEGTEFEPEIEELKSYGWTVTMTGKETSEYAYKHRATECFTRRVAMIRLPLEDRVVLAEQVAAEIEDLKAKIKADNKSRNWDTYLEDAHKLTSLKRKKQIILFAR